MNWAQQMKVLLIYFSDWIGMLSLDFYSLLKRIQCFLLCISGIYSEEPFM